MTSISSHQPGAATKVTILLVGCTPNGVISFVSPLYVGSISDVELTCTYGLLEKIEGKWYICDGRQRFYHKGPAW